MNTKEFLEFFEDVLEFYSFIAGVGFGFLVLVLWHTYNVPGICIPTTLLWGKFRWMHFNSGIILIVAGAVAYYFFNRYEILEWRFVTIFLVGFGIGMILDDAFWHYSIIKDGFNYTSGCS